MRGKKALIGILLLGMALTGCSSSDKKYDDLEKRVAVLESKLNISSATLKDGTAEIAPSEPTTNTTVKSGLPFYYIDQLSVQEITDKFKYLYQNPPRKGETFEEYYSNFEVKPILTPKSKGEADVNCLWIDHSGNGRNISEVNPNYTVDKIDRDAIISVAVPFSQTEMDGTIGYSADMYAIHMYLLIKDYNRASQIYDELYKWIPENCGYTNIRETRQTEIWQTYGEFQFANGSSERQFLTMCKRYMVEDVEGYVIEIMALGNQK